MVKTLAAIGECMLEFAPVGHNHYDLNFAGDVFNTALYCARCCNPVEVKVAFATALGDDPYSDRMVAFCQNEQINCDLIQRLAQRMPGLYLIENDASGEREFYYYRNASAARDMFDEQSGDILAKKLPKYDYLYFSGITVAILDDRAQAKLISCINQAKQNGAKVAFDSNFRSRLWSSREQALHCLQQFLPLVDVALVSFDDEQALFQDVTPEETAHRWLLSGATDVIVKCGKLGYLLATSELKTFVPLTAKVKVVDATGAGDSFNGAYLAYRLQGLSQQSAAAKAAAVAAAVVAHHGAIIPKSAMPKKA